MVQPKEDFFDNKFPMARLTGKSRGFKLLGIYIFHKSPSSCFSSCTWVKYKPWKAVYGYFLVCRQNLQGTKLQIRYICDNIIPMAYNENKHLEYLHVWSIQKDEKLNEGPSQS